MRLIEGLGRVNILGGPEVTTIGWTSTNSQVETQFDLQGMSDFLLIAIDFSLLCSTYVATENC